MKKCTKCNEVFPSTTDFFYTYKSKSTGERKLQSQCKFCNGKKRISAIQAREGYRFCTKCGEEYPSTDDYFHVSKANKDGLINRCKICGKGVFMTKIKARKGYKFCADCGEELLNTSDNFYKDSQNKCGLAGACKNCSSIESERYRKETSYNERYYQENREKEIARKKKWQEENKEYLISYREKNRKRMSERHKKWRINNKDKVQVNIQRYYTKKRSLQATLTSEQWTQIKKDFNNECAYCGMSEKESAQVYKQRLHQEHFIALSKGGEYTHNNIIPSCKICNVSKSNKDFFEWYRDYKHYSKSREDKILKYLGYKEEMQQLALF